MDKATLQKLVIEKVADTAVDIEEYFASDIPIESHQKDIDHKLMLLALELKELIDGIEI